MLGAIIGDTIGSIYEFNNVRYKNFPLFKENSSLTDDSIMSFAVLDILNNGYINDNEKIIDTFKKWGRSYPGRGYGYRFFNWLISENREPYNSYGNGSAMRVSACAWYADNIEDATKYAINVTKVTHNHAEGIKGAVVTCKCIYYARVGKSKDYIKEYALKEYPIIGDLNYYSLKKYYRFDETCQNTVPQAIYCFLISNSFEDAIRTAISIGGDSDTLAAITGSIAEAYYKDIDNNLIDEVYKRLPEDAGGCEPKKLLDSFIEYKNKKNSSNND